MIMARMVSRQEAAELLNVSPQTISNWVGKGVLNARNSIDGRNTLLIDRKSIERFFDTLEDLALLEKRISIQKNSLKEKQVALDEKIKEMSSANYLFGKGISPYLLRDIFCCVIEVAGDTLLKDREFEILKSLINGSKIDDIAEEYHLTTSRIMQIINKAIHKVSTMMNWPEWHEDYKRVVEENRYLSVLIENQQVCIKELEEMLNVKRGVEEEESGIPGYSKMELEKVLGRRLDEENLSIRCLNCLRYADIVTVRDLVRVQRTDLMKYRNFGVKSLRELDEYLDSLNLSFGMDINLLVNAEVEQFLNNRRSRNGVVG